MPSKSQDATKNFTPHRSHLTEEGRRNQPRVMSPKKVKKKKSEKNRTQVERRKELGALERFVPEDQEQIPTDFTKDV